MLPPCRIDDEILEHALKDFPELSENNYEKLVKLDEEWMKSDDGKKRWRDFIQQWVALSVVRCEFSTELGRRAC